ncbi:hypothetical protein WT26_25225 [Burkholderia cepacia]|uniref:Rieske domain-containing protein n=2 Tax=Burkholderia cepacia complex TaxID=87882 RepID=A0A1B4PZ79_BURCE|nr:MULTISPECIES: Rieske (2Fe-2S) protein [Burkholderia cepacia complex]AOK19247.1 hypothetical protein WT26_25225 [Burkholderia cepacia]AOK26005.1 hypothetical protein WK67_25105 [Burkholderia ubonensis]
MSTSNAPRVMCVRLCNLHELPDRGSRGFDPHAIGRDMVLVVRDGASVYAYADSCPHHPGAPMAWRKDAYLNGDGTRIVCHGHGAQFDIATGACVLGPCLGQALTPLSLDVDERDDVWLRS